MANSTAISASRIAVIGAGIGGLVAAAHLAHAGHAVTVLERAAAPGGKLRQVTVDGTAIDCGPTVLTMRSVFEEIFAALGTSVEAHLQLRPAAVLARHAWRAGEHLDLHADIDAAADAIGRFAGAAEARGYRAFTARARRTFATLDRPFIHADRPSMLGLVRALGPGADLFSIAPFTTLWQALGAHFKDPRLRQLFGRYATYCGSSPFASPATLMLVAHVEQSGVWLVDGGMVRIAETLAGLAASHGAQLRYEAEVGTIRTAGGRVAAVDLTTGERLAVDAVVCNADVAAFAAGLFGPDVARAAAAPGPRGRSLSALTFALRANATDFPLLRHNVFFSDDYAAEFGDIIGRGRLPQAPTVYVCAQDREAATAPSGPERLFCIVNAPATADTRPLDPSEIAQCEAKSFQMLEQRGLTIARTPQNQRTTTPADFARSYPATGGALYGAASHGWTASFRRPGVRSKVPGLYLCGGSTHPGPGLPMAALSGRMAAASLMADWASTRRSYPAAMRGGMSTA